MAENFGRMESVNIFSGFRIDIHELDSGCVPFPCYAGMPDHCLRNDPSLAKEKTDLYW